MTAQHRKERDLCIRTVLAHGWTVRNVNPKTGYTKLGCACGEHLEWIPKTPSLPGTFRRKTDHMIRTCSLTGQK